MSKIARSYQDSSLVKLLVIIGSFVTVASLLALPLSFVTGWSFGHAFDASFRSIGIFSLVGGFGWMVVSRLGAGPVLLNAGAQPQRNLYLIFVLSYVVLSLSRLDFRESPFLWLRSQADILLLATFFAVLAFGRLQVYERGVLLYAILLPWYKIKSYTWQDGVLYLKTKTFWFVTRETRVVPKGDIEALDTYLRTHVSQRERL